MKWLIVAAFACAMVAWCFASQARAQRTSGPAAPTPTATASAPTAGTATASAATGLPAALPAAQAGDSGDSPGDSGSNSSPQQPVAPAPVHQTLVQPLDCHSSDPVFVQYTPRDIQGLKAARARYAAEKAAALNRAGNRPVAIPQSGTARSEKSIPAAAAILKSILEKMTP